MEGGRDQHRLHVAVEHHDYSAPFQLANERGVRVDVRYTAATVEIIFKGKRVASHARCYATLPALAIYQLATRPGIEAVGVMRFVWNGRERLLAEVEAPGARASDPASMQIAEGATLGLPTISEA